MLKRRLVWCAVLLLSTASGAAAQAALPRSPGMDGALAEAVLRKFLAVVGPIPTGSSWRVPSYLCLSVGKNDPSDSVLRRLQDIRPPFVAVSACENRGKSLLRKVPSDSIMIRPPDSMLTMVHRATGQRAWGIAVDTEVVSYDGRAAWVVRASYYVAPLWAGGWRCIATRQGSSWKVSDCWQEWISLGPMPRRTLEPSHDKLRPESPAAVAGSDRRGHERLDRERTSMSYV